MKSFYAVAKVLSHEHENPSGSKIQIRSLRVSYYVDEDGNKRTPRKKDKD